MEQLPLFVFGTLRQGQCNHFLLAGKYGRKLAAELHGFVRVHPLMIVPGAGGKVQGELYFLHAHSYSRTLADCDELEEVPANTLIGPDYRRLRVRVSTEEGEFDAWVYVASETPNDWSSPIRRKQ
jgi:gamma-glutamylcyclotransferase (GGCT)/AIG2-like uncharacterized protein YtfP